jgi:hypothetical protein
LVLAAQEEVAMNELAWLVGHRFQSLARREYDWVVAFDKGASLFVACLWRLVESGRIRFTSEDDGQQFGLPAPVDAAAEITARLAGAAVEAVELREGLLDLELRFSTGHSFQIIPDSSGYEAWNVCIGNEQFIAVGGGELAIFGGVTGHG